MRIRDNNTGLIEFSNYNYKAVRIYIQCMCSILERQRETMSSNWAINTLRRVAADLQRFSDGRRIDEDQLDAFNLSLHLAYRELAALECFNRLDSCGQLAMECVRRALENIEQMQEDCDDEQVYRHPAIIGNHAGRPRFEIPRSQLTFLVESGFTGPQMAEMLGVSLRTVRRRLSEYRISISAQYSTVSDDQLDELVAEIQQQFPLCGNRQMLGHLLARGLRVQQIRVREAQRRVDPEGSVMRRLRTINRRSYSVVAPRGLWHIDGNHKLIR